MTVSRWSPPSLRPARSSRSRLSGLRLRKAALVAFAAGGLLAACAYPRIPNRYRADLDGKMTYAEGNDGELAASIKVSIVDVKEKDGVRTHTILFENFSREPQSFEYEIRWFNRVGLLAGKPSEWIHVDMQPQDQINAPAVQPDLPDLSHVEITVRPADKAAKKKE